MKRLVTTCLILSVVIALIVRFQVQAAGRSLQEFAAKAYSSVAADQVALHVAISNSLQSNNKYEPLEGQQQLVVEVTACNKSLKDAPRIIASLRFSEDVKQYLDLEAALVFDFGSLPAYSERTSVRVLSIPQFNSDSQAIAEVSSLLAQPLMVQVLVGDKPDYLLVTPEVSLLHQPEQEEQPAKFAGIPFSVDEASRLMLCHYRGECIVLLDGVKHGVGPYLNASKDKVAVVVDAEDGDTVYVCDLTGSKHYLYHSSRARVMGWLGTMVLVGTEISHGIELELIGLDGCKEALPFGVLPLPLSPPVWDVEGRFAAYSALGNTVVVIDINRYQSYTLTYASDPEWTPHGLQVVHDSIARVVQFRH